MYQGRERRKTFHGDETSERCFQNVENRMKPARRTFLRFIASVSSSSFELPVLEGKPATGASSVRHESAAGARAPPAASASPPRASSVASARPPRSRYIRRPRIGCGCESATRELRRPLARVRRARGSSAGRKSAAGASPAASASSAKANPLRARVGCRSA